MHFFQCVAQNAYGLAIDIAMKRNEFLSFFAFSYIFLYLQNSPALEIHKNETLAEVFSLKTPIYFAMYLSFQLWGYIYVHIFMSYLNRYMHL